MESAYYVDTGLLSPDATGIQIMSIFGSSTLTSSSSRSGAAAKASAAAAAAAAPPFPTFLLPALPLQLFRRQQKRQQQQQQQQLSSSSSSPPSSVAHSNNSNNDNSRTDEDYYEEDSNSDDEGATPSLSGSVDSAPSETSGGGGGGGVDAAQQHQGLQRRRPRRRLAPPTPATLRCGICATDLAFASQIVSKGFTGRHGRAFLVAPASPSNIPAVAGRLLLSRPSATAADGELVNIKIGRSENRQLVTGSHVVADISCRVCGTKVGWKYVDARESQQKYKVGKFILETARVVAWRGWDAGRPPAAAGDSDDDDDDDDDYDDDDGEYAWSSASEHGAHSTRPGTGTASGQKGEAEADRADDDEGPVVFDSDDDDECEDIFAGTWNAETVAKRRKMRRALVGRRV